jgi:SAM-dependent methyltransferase
VLFDPPPCPLCGAARATLDRTLRRAEVTDEWRRWLDLDIGGELEGFVDIPQWRCVQCGLVFFPAATAGTGRLYEALQRFPWYYVADKWEYAEALRDIPDGARLCEPGCGAGDFLLQAIAARQVRALGLELNPHAVHAARTRGLPVEARALEAVASEQEGQFDVVCSFQVLEHVPNPGEHLRAARAMLKPGGRLLLGLPNTDSFLGREDNILDRPPHHISRWSLAVVQRAFPALGFRVVRSATEPLIAFHTRSFLVAQLRSRLARHLPRPLAWLVMRPRVLNALEWVLLRTGWHRVFLGQTLYVMAEATEPGSHR